MDQIKAHKDVFDSARSRAWITVQSRSDDWNIFILLCLLFMENTELQ